MVPFGEIVIHGSLERLKSAPFMGFPPEHLEKIAKFRIQVFPPSRETPVINPCAPGPPPAPQRSCCQMPTRWAELFGSMTSQGSTSAFSKLGVAVVFPSHPGGKGLGPETRTGPVGGGGGGGGTVIPVPPHPNQRTDSRSATPNQRPLFVALT